MSAKWNEQVKMVATTINNIGLGVIAAGILKPLAETGTVPWRTFLAFAYMALVIHVCALYILERIK